jgi:hypothetical protein
MQRTIIFFLILLLFGCSKDNKNNQDKNLDKYNLRNQTVNSSKMQNANEEANRSAIIRERKFTISDSRYFIIVEQKGDGWSARDISFKSSGFPENKIFKYDGVGYVDTVMITDLNSDGIKEFYVTIGNGGSGGMEDLYVFTYDKNSIIKVDTKCIENVTDGNYFDVSKIQGHDNYHISRGYLINTVPLYNDDDANCCPTGGQMNICYKIVIVNDSVKLEFVKTE